MKLTTPGRRCAWFFFCYIHHEDTRCAVSLAEDGETTSFRLEMMDGFIEITLIPNGVLMLPNVTLVGRDCPWLSTQVGDKDLYTMEFRTFINAAKKSIPIIIVSGTHP